MDFGSGAGGSGRDDNAQDSPASEGLKRKWSDLEASMNAMKDAFVQENAEKSAKIRRLMEDNARLEATVLRLENSPFQGPMERPNPFAVFPAEVWEAIIEQMDDSSDLEMLCLAFSPLEPLVKKNKKAIFLFENILPFLCEHLKLKEINNCRLVCQKWNQDLCTLMANWNAPNLLPTASSSSDKEVTSETRVPDHTVPSKLLRAYLFQDHLKLQMFLNEMADHQRNPFFGRFLRLRLDGRIAIKDFWKSVLEMVEKFGEHIWNLEVRRHDGFGFQSPTSFYEVLRETLVYIPNLRYLTVALRFPDYELDEMRMATTIGFSPLPSLPHLQSLDLDFCSDAGMSKAFSLFLLCSKQFYQLTLRHGTFEELKDELLRGLHNLEHLEVALDPIINMPRLLKLPSPKLCLHSIYFSSPTVLNNSGQVASLLEKFARLEHLDLTRCDVKPSSSAGLRVQFSSLKTLEIAAGRPPA